MAPDYEPTLPKLGPVKTKQVTVQIDTQKIDGIGWGAAAMVGEDVMMTTGHRTRRAALEALAEEIGEAVSACA